MTEQEFKLDPNRLKATMAGDLGASEARALSELTNYDSPFSQLETPDTDINLSQLQLGNLTPDQIFPLTLADSVARATGHKGLRRYVLATVALSNSIGEDRRAAMLANILIGKKQSEDNDDKKREEKAKDFAVNES